MIQKNRFKKNFGDDGEKAAAEYLSNHGYSILAQNFRFSRMGEIDIIARKNEYICFIEVKTRSSIRYGVPSESVNRKKQERMTRLAYVYLKSKGLRNENIRFDVMEIIAEIRNDEFVVRKFNLIENAFGGG